MELDALFSQNTDKNYNQNADNLASQIQFNVPLSALEENSIAIICIDQEINAFESIKKAFYELNHINKCPIIYDLGTLYLGKTEKDTLFAVSEALEYLLKKNIIPLLLAKDEKIIYSNYVAYKNLEQSINLVSLSSHLNIGNINDELSNENYVSKIINHKPSYLFNYSNLCYQEYYINPKELLLIDKLYFSAQRLGEVQEDIKETEPIIRDASIVAFSLDSIKHSDCPATKKNSPNGLNGPEACKLSYYAGISDKLSSIGFYGFDSQYDIRETGAKQVSQILWYFIKGVSERKKDYPIGSKKNYLKYNIEIDEGHHEIIFYKSPSQRWWIEVQIPHHKTSKYKRNVLIPCSKKDYEQAINNEFPDIWWKGYQKLI